MIKIKTYPKLFLSACLSISIVGCGGGSSKGDTGNAEPSITENVTAINALVQSSDGTLLKGVTVSVLDQKAVTNENGIAQLNVKVPKDLNEVVVKYEAEGFVSQSILVKVSELSNITANLLAAKEIVPVDDIAVAQVIKAESLGATITIPADAFIDTKGRLAQGKVNVEFTPWDINSNDSNAMPANGFALDAQGNRTQLMSAGMITATFKDAATGEKLQLASKKTADIQMDLPLKSINNQEMKVGTEIPMWHFDEAKGLWVEEGKGQVVASSTSASGLAVHATVSHFSTWNMSLPAGFRKQVFVQCRDQGTPVPCSATAHLVLDDQSAQTRVAALPANGSYIPFLPENANVTWTAKALNGTTTGTLKSDLSGDVYIDLSKAVASNLVNCELASGRSTLCHVILNDKVSYTIAKDGSKILLSDPITASNFTWKATSPIQFESNQWVRYKGEVTSDSFNNVKIILNEKEIINKNASEMSFNFVCTSTGYQNTPAITLWKPNLNLDGKMCDIKLSINLDTGIREQLNYQVEYGNSLKVTLPNKFSGFSTNNGNVTSVYVSTVLTDYNNDPYTAYLTLTNPVFNDEFTIIELLNY